MDTLDTWAGPCWNCHKWLHDGLPSTAWSFIIICAACFPLWSMNLCWGWWVGVVLCRVCQWEIGWSSEGGEGLMELTHFSCVCAWCHKGEIIRMEPRNQSDTFRKWTDLSLAAVCDGGLLRNWRKRFSNACPIMLITSCARPSGHSNMWQADKMRVYVVRYCLHLHFIF